MKLYQVLLSLFLPITLLFVVVVVLFSYNRHKLTLTTNALKETSTIIFKKKNDIDMFLHHTEGELMFLSELSNLDKLINLKDESDIKIAKAGLEKDFLGFSENSKIYYQIRYLDETGQEVVRVDFDGDKAEIVEEEELQNKKGRYYFDDAVKMAKGSIFVSPLDLNIENGEVENRGTKDIPDYVPVIRYGTPVFDDEGDSKGIILTNVYADHFLESFNEEDKEFFIVNKDGFYLSHPDKNKEWGFMFENSETIQADYPLMSKKILADEAGQLLNDEGDNYFTFSKVSSRNWMLLSINKKADILKPVIEEKNAIISLISIIFVIVTIVAVFISKAIFRPIGKLKLVVDEISKGKLDAKIDEKVLKNKSEVGDLARAFDRTLVSLKLAMREEASEKSSEPPQQAPADDQAA